MNMEIELELAMLRTMIDDALHHVSNPDGAHHKQYVVDQMVRALTGDYYEAWVRSWESCGNFNCTRHHSGTNGNVDCDGGYNWDVGIE